MTPMRRLPIVILAGSVALFPFSEALGSAEAFGVTLDVFSIAMFALAPFAFRGLLKGVGAARVTWLDLWVVVTALMYFTSTLTGVGLESGGYIGFHGLFMPVLSFMVVRGLIVSKEEHSTVRWAMLFGLTTFSVAALLGFIWSGGDGRVDVFGRDSIAVGTFGMVATVLWLFGGARAWAWRGAGGLVTAAATGSSLSRGYVVAMVLSPVLQWVVRRGWALLAYVLIMAITFVGTLLLAQSSKEFRTTRWNPEFENRVERLLNPEYWKFGLHGRGELYRNSIEVIEAHPVLGTGMRVSEGWGTTVHNLHLEWLEYGGLVGYVSFNALFITYLLRTGRVARRDPESAAFIVSILAILLNGITNGVMHGVMPYVLYLLLGLGASRAYLCERET